MPRAETRADIASQCLDHVSIMLLRGAPFGILGAALLARLLADAVGPARAIAWFVVVTVVALSGMAVMYTYRVRSRRAVISRWIPGVISTIALGLAWASVAFIAFPSPKYEVLRAVILLFCLATSASAIVSAGASRVVFYAYQIPLIAPLSYRYFTAGDATTRTLGIAFVVYLVGMSSMHHEVHKTITSEMTLRSELHDANEQLVKLALFDTLTGLQSRAAFNDALGRAIEQSRRSGECLGVLFFDVDRFKVFNDSYGHATGDAVLVSVADRVRPLLRAGDSFARLGGDEFAILLRDLDCTDHARDIAERIRASFSGVSVLNGFELSPEVSIGVATTFGGVRDAGALLHEADVAQYEAKRRNGSAVVVSDHAIRARLRKEIDDEAALRDAVVRSEVTAYFQPEVDLATRQIVGGEALVRWPHAVRGLLSAGDFLPAINDPRLRQLVDAYVVAQTVEARRALASSGAVPDDFRLWFNTGGSRLTIARFAELEQFLIERGVPASQLGVEITEEQLLVDIDGAAECLAAARAAGLAVALDDFGTGASSLSLVRDLPIDVLKIDRRFVRDIENNRVDRAIVEAITTLAHRLGVQIVAEGVETAEQEQVLRDLGAHVAQGYLYAPALPIDEFALFVTQSHTALLGRR